MNVRFVNGLSPGYGGCVPKISAEHREARREEILGAARRRFACEGFHATSMQDILAESGLSAGAVYRYFNGKSDIVAAIAGESMGAVLESLSEYAESAADVPVADAVVAILQRIRAIIRGLLLGRHPDLGDDADAVAGAVAALIPGFLHQLAMLDPSAT